MHLTVGVVTFNNNTKDLARFTKAYQIASQEVSPEHSVSLIWIDNGAPSSLTQWIPKAERLASEGNVGYTRSINRIMRHAFEHHSADAFVPANPDGAFHHLALKNFIKHHQAFPKSLLEARQFPEEHPKVYDPASLETPWCSGCCLFISKELFQKVGSFDENFFMYMEDVDFSWRVRSLGFSTQLCPNVLFGHYVVDRGQSEVSVHQHFLSARYLGWKWGHRRFFKWAEKTLLKKKGFTPATLPTLPSQRPYFSRAQKRVTCFNKIFSFGDRRW
jgi:GT2 family glycosyltransferase